MTSYQVTVERDGRFWYVEVEGVGVTSARHLREVEVMARDLIAILREVPPDSFELDVDVRLPESARVHVEASVRLRDEAAAAQSAAATEIRAAATELAGQGLPLRDVGALLGVSHQRAHQLVKD